MILFISNSGECCPIAQRIQAEGEKVQIYLHHPAYKNSFDGIINSLAIRDLPKAVRDSDLIIFDNVKADTGLKRDKVLLKIFNCDEKSTSIFGTIADKLRKRGKKVIGTSTWTEQLELDRFFGTKIAQKTGLPIPVTYNFDKLSEAADFLANKNSLWVLKPHNNISLDLTYVEKFPGELYYRLQNDIKKRVGKDNFPCMLQKKIEGTAISTEGWFNGKDFTLFNHTYEEKAFMDGGLGVHVGSQSNTVWTKPEGINQIVRNSLVALSGLLKEAKYIGPIDVNCIIAEKNGKPYFLEWTPRFGYDALFALLALYKGKIKDFFLNDFENNFDETKISCSQRISIPPYPYEIEEDLKIAKSIQIKNKIDKENVWYQDVKLNDKILQCGGADGIISVVTGIGYSIGEAANNVYNTINELKIGNYVQYRTDMKDNALKAVKELGLLKVGGN